MTATCAPEHPAAWYDANARRFFDQTVALDTSDVRARFEARLPRGGRVLDAGCGSGRDSLHFARAGLRVDAFDVSGGMVRLAREHTGLPVRRMDLADVPPCGDYDGVWAMASLIHLDASALPDALARLGRALRPGGVLLASFRQGREGFTRRGLPFNALDEAALRRVLAAQDVLALDEAWERPDDRPGRPPWLFALMIRAGASGDHNKR